MTTRHPRPPSRSKPRTALALAGGGPLGAIYEIGALCALDEALQGLDFNGFDHYVGVSAGGFIVAGLANGLTPRQLCTSFVENRGPATDLIRPGLFFRPAWQEYAQRVLTAPRLAGQAACAALAGIGLLSQSLDQLEVIVERGQSIWVMAKLTLLVFD